MNIIADTHTHTLANDHAFSTITENATIARKKGIKILCYTEHTKSLPGAPSDTHFWGIQNLPRYINDVIIIRGAEINILDFDGRLDLTEEVMHRLEWRIASMHMPCLTPSTKEDHTRGWLKIAENPYINVIGHLGDSRFEADYETIIKAFAANGKIVEINAHSKAARPGSEVNCPKILKLCEKYGVPVVISSDSHYHEDIGSFEFALKIIKENGFPEEMILNADYDRFMGVLKKINGENFI